MPSAISYTNTVHIPAAVTGKKSQPDLPAPVPYTDPELLFADEEPPAFFPDNQNSNWGFMRKLFSDQMQQANDQLITLYTERFAQNANELLDLWEEQVGLPINPSGRTIAERRQTILSRLQVGLFTRTRRAAVVSNFITATLGEAIALLPAGVDLSLTPQLFSGETSTTGLYAIVEDIPNFSYTVRVKNTVSPDIPGMTRELTKITPAGINFSIVLVATP